MVDDKVIPAEFNMAVSYLNRINYIFYICNEAATNLDMYKWFHGLLNLYRELSTEMFEDDTSQATEYINKIDPLISKYNAPRNKLKNAENRELFFLLHNFENFLRKILKRSGLQMKMKDDLLEPEEEW